MSEYLSFVTIDVWTLIFSWANLLILFLLLKKFLFKPINKILKERADEIEGSYKNAENAENEAQALKVEYEEKLSSSKDEAQGIIKTAVESANQRSQSIVDEANDEAKHIIARTTKQIEQEKINAVNEARSDVASMAIDIAEKVLNKKLDKEEDEKLIVDIIDRI